MMAKRWKFFCLDELGLEYPFGDCHRCCAKILLDWGVDVDGDGEFGTALQTAEKFQNKKGVKMLLEKGAVY